MLTVFEEPQPRFCDENEQHVLILTYVIQLLDFPQVDRSLHGKVLSCEARNGAEKSVQVGRESFIKTKFSAKANMKS